MLASQLAFIRQLGFSLQKPDDVLYSALMFQPRIVGGILAIGVLFQSAWIFLALSAVLWWGTFVPTQNAFDAIYNIGEIGRASCREKSVDLGGRRIIKKKKQT